MIVLTDKICHYQFNTTICAQLYRRDFQFLSNNKMWQYKHFKLFTTHSNISKPTYRAKMQKVPCVKKFSLTWISDYMVKLDPVTAKTCQIFMVIMSSKQANDNLFLKWKWSWLVLHIKLDLKAIINIIIILHHHLYFSWC